MEAIGWKFEHSYTNLPSLFYTRTKPTPVPQPQLVMLNKPLADSLGLNVKALEERLDVLAGNVVPEGADPIAQAYAGHQYGHFTNLGDGRAILYGEHITAKSERFDVQLKGAGQTPFSRRGDGRAALGPMLREYVISEGMHALGIPTSRSLAVLTTGQRVLREIARPGAVLVRVAASHIRIGTFEYAALRGGKEACKILADYVIARHYPDLGASSNPYLDLLKAVSERQAALIAHWLQVGFIHGVMNTDNMAVSGETIDYGPCAFMENYDPSAVFSSIDRHGRYAYANQPQVAQWNLARFADTLLPLIDETPQKARDLAQSALELFANKFTIYWTARMRAKLGLATEEKNDMELVESLLQWMQKHHADYTNTFCLLSSISSAEKMPLCDEEFKQWYIVWKERLMRQPQPFDAIELMRKHNPAFIPRNHRVEEALNKAEMEQDYTLLQRLLAVLSRPYDDQPENQDYQKAATPEERVNQTFCGT